MMPNHTSTRFNHNPEVGVKWTRTRGLAGSQSRISTRGVRVQCLDLGLLIDAQHDRVLRRGQVQPKDIDDLLDLGGQRRSLLPGGAQRYGQVGAGPARRLAVSLSAVSWRYQAR